MRQKQLKLLLNNYPYYLFWLIILFILITNTIHFSYPDEFDNITGGWFILHGRLPYSGFFTHHGPFAYFLAAPLILLAGGSFVYFRIILSIALWLSFIVSFLYFKKRFGQLASNSYLLWIGLIALGGTFFWGHMLLADSLAGYLIVPVYMILLFSSLQDKILRFRELITTSVLLSMALLTSLTFIYLIFIAYLWIGLKLIQQYGANWRNWFKVGFIMAAPWLLFILYLLLSQSLSDFYLDTIVYNQQYYVRTTDGAQVTNPLRYAITITVTFFNNFISLTTLIKDFNFSNPFNSTLALSNIIMCGYLLINRRYSTALFLLGFLIFANARSNPLSSQETDYQANVYTFLSLFNGSFLLINLRQEIRQQLNFDKKLFYSLSLISLVIFYFFLSLFFFQKWQEKTYLKYMGQQAIIYDRPAVANLINQLTTTDDYVYVGPFAFEDWLYIKAQPVSKYFIALPGMDAAPEIQSQVIKDFQHHPPKLVVFNTNMQILGKSTGRYLLDYLKSDYFTLEQLQKSHQFNIQVGDYGDYILRENFFFRKDQEVEILNKLVDLKIISQPFETTPSAKFK